MKFAIVGAGGVGGYYGGLLAQAGEDVTFVARGDHFRALQESGLTLRTVDGEHSIKSLRVVDAVEKIDDPEVIIVATKTYDRDDVARRLCGVVNEGTIVLPVLNGIDNDLRLKEILPRARVLAGLVYIISTRTGPGVIEQTAGPRTMFFGERGTRPDETLKTMEAVMNNAGLRATASADIERELWTKFVWLTTFAGMTSLCRSSIGPIVDDEIAFGIFVKCLDEGFAVANASGVEFDREARAAIIRKSEDYRLTGRNAKSSMLVDIENNRRTEIESLNGALVRLGEARGIETPLHRVILSAVRIASEQSLAKA